MTYTKRTNCIFCNEPFKGMNASQVANHTRWCNLNPKRKEYEETLRRVRETSPHLNQFSKARQEGLPIPKGAMFGKPGTMLGKTHSDSTKEKIREKALSSPHRRLRRKMIEYITVDGLSVVLDSTWELALAKRLDECGIKWVRPAPIKYIGKDKREHNYFADFYLPEVDLYLDPKNPRAYQVQLDKIECLIDQVSNLKFLRSLDECKNFGI